MGGFSNPRGKEMRRKVLWFAVFELDLWTVLKGNARRTKSVFYGFVLASVAAFVGAFSVSVARQQLAVLIAGE